MRLAICNEIYQGRSLADAAKAISAAGYDGIEIAPFTLSENPAAISQDHRREIRDIIRSEGLQLVGLHWLMVAPKGLHVTTPDRALREKSWRHIHDLVDLCSDLGDRGVMVFGSPQQRSTVDGSTVEEAVQRYTDGLAKAAPHALERGVTILVEALPSNQSNVVTTLAQAAAIVREIASPAIQTMFDTHNTVDETEPHPALIEKYFDLIRHVHLNEMDGRHPGAGNYAFRPVFEMLKRLGYTGFLSLEVFDFAPGADRIGRESMDYLKRNLVV